MAEYTDLPYIESLYAEQARIQQALTLLEDYDGTVISYTVAPGPPPIAKEGEPLPVVPPTMPPMSVMITTVDPGQSLMAGIHTNLIQRYNDINKELRDLGVTGGPPDHAQGGGPPVITTQPAEEKV